MLPVMKWLPSIGRTLVIGSSVALLSACGGDEESETAESASASSAPEQTVSASPNAAEGDRAADTSSSNGEGAAAPATGISARDALFDHLVYSAGKAMSEQASDPVFNESVKLMLEKMVAYYDELAASGKVTPERVRLGLRIGEVCRDLGAYRRALTYYEKAESDFNALPEERRNSDAGLRVLSAINNGFGTCLYCQGRFDEAQARYRQALELDRTAFRRLEPEQRPLTNELISRKPELTPAVCELLGSYRCLGDCIRQTGEIEDARDVYKDGVRLAQELSLLSPPMTISLCRLLSDLGDLESATGNYDTAAKHWVSSLQLINTLEKNSQASITPRMRLDMNRMKTTLVRALQELQRLEQARKAAAEPAPEPAVAPAADAPADQASSPAEPAAASADAPAAADDDRAAAASSGSAENKTADNKNAASSGKAQKRTKKSSRSRSRRR